MFFSKGTHAGIFIIFKDYILSTMNWGLFSPLLFPAEVTVFRQGEVRNPGRPGDGGRPDSEQKRVPGEKEEFHIREFYGQETVKVTWSNHSSKAESL